MKRMLTCIFWLWLPIALWASLSSQSKTSKSTITAADAHKHIGKAMTVCGKVKKVTYHSTLSGESTYITFKENFGLYISGINRKNFRDPEADYLDQRICVSGTIGEDSRIFLKAPYMEVSTPEQIKIGINSSPRATPNKSSSSSVKPFHNRIAVPAPTSTVTYSFSGISGAGGFVGGSYPGPLQGLSQSFSFKVPALITNSESIPVANITTCIDGISALSGCKNVTLAPNAATVNGTTYDQLIFSAKTNRNEDDRYYTFYYFFPANSFITQGTYTAIPLRFVLFSGGTGTLIISSSAAEVP